MLLDISNNLHNYSELMECFFITFPDARLYILMFPYRSRIQDEVVPNLMDFIYSILNFLILFNPF